MNKFKVVVFGVLSAAILTMGLFSCSDEEMINSQQENTEQMPMQSKSALLSSDDGYLYAETFYGAEADISLGNFIDLTDPDSSDGVIVTEVIVSGDTRARGYIVDDIHSGDFLYFADVDRVNDVLTTYEASTAIQEVFDNLLESEDYLITDKFDFIEYSPEYTTYGSDCNFLKKLWGKCTTHGPVHEIGMGLCGQSSNTTTYRLGFATKTDPNYNTFPCG